MYTPYVVGLAALATSCSALNIRQAYSNSTSGQYNSSSSTVASSSNDLISSSSKSIPLTTAPESTSSDIPYTSPTYSFAPRNSSTPYGPTGTGTTNTITCGGGATLNVLDASLDWWYGETLYYPVSTISLLFNNNDTQTGWTVLPATTPFDVNSALVTQSCDSSLAFDASANTSYWDINCVAAPTPVAASTTIITQTAYTTLSANTGTGPIPNPIVTPPPASLTIPEATNTFLEGTAFVHFSAYEIITKTPRTQGDSTVGCATVTETTTMETPFAFAYEGPNVNGSSLVGAGVTGDVNPAFLDIVGVDTARAGSWVAEPTVALIVQKVFVAQAVLAATVDQQSLLVPEPTVPSFFSPVGPTEPGHFTSATGNPRGVESSGPFLLVPTPTRGPPMPDDPGQRPDVTPQPVDDGRVVTLPFVGNSGGTDITLNIPVNPTDTVVTAGFSGGTLVVTRIPGGQPTQGGFGGFLPAVISAIRPKPTNALEVLSQAEQTFKGANPTAAAILSGISPSDNAPGGVDVNFVKVPANRRVVPMFVVDGTTFAGDSSTQFNFGPSGTLTPGGTAVFAGTTFSLAPSGTAVVVNGQTQVVSPATMTPAPVLALDGQSITANGGSTYVIGGQTLTPGGVITADGTTVSLGPGATEVVVNGQTVSASPAGITAAPIITIGDETYSPINGGPTYDINGETLAPGEEGTVSVDGTTYIVSLYPDATALLVETLGPDGSVTATSVATLSPAASGSASAGSRSSAGPSATYTPAIAQGSAVSLTLQVSSICLAMGSFVLAVWL